MEKTNDVILNMNYHINNKCLFNTVIVANILLQKAV